MEDLKVKKYLALLLALVMVFALAACGSTAETPAATEAPAAEPETPAEEPAAEADPMEDLIAAAKAEGELTVYGSCEEEYLAAACQHFQEPIRKQNLRPVYNRSGYRHSLLLSSGKLCWFKLHPVCQSDTPQCLSRPLPSLLFWNPGIC